jgi:hypothetical protein
MKQLKNYWADFTEMLYLRRCFNRNEYQNMFNAEHDMRIQLSKTVPDFKALVPNKQFYPSH